LRQIKLYIDGHDFWTVTSSNTVQSSNKTVYMPG